MRAASAALRTPQAAAAAARTVVNGVLLGLLREDELDVLDERYYDALGTYTTPEWTERGLFDWERELVESQLSGRRRVVVTSCGGGREVLALLGLGFDAVGYEPHPGLAAWGSEFLASKGHPGRVHVCARSRFPAQAGPCDAVIVGWGAFPLIPSRRLRVAYLAGARRAVGPGGPVLLSLLQRTADSRELRWTRSLASGLRRARGLPPAELGDTLAPYHAHLFTREELEAELAAAGLAADEYRITGAADSGTRYACVAASAR